MGGVGGRRSRAAEKRPANYQRAQARILEALTAEPGARTAELSSQLKLDQETIRTVLVALEEAGTARREGRTRGTRWYLTEGVAPTAPTGDGAEDRAERPARSARKTHEADGAAYGWRVTLVVRGAETDRIVVSDSLAAAAALAASGARALGAEITGIVRIGRALQRP